MRHIRNTSREKKLKYDEFLKGEFSLAPEQVEGVDFLIEKQWAILGDEMGIGKTLQSLIPSFIGGVTTLIVCPGSLRINWKREIEKFSKTTKRITIANSKKELDEIEVGEVDYIIISYNLCSRVGFLYELCQCWIFDESHYLKTWDSARSKSIREMVLVCRPIFLFMLTGTPVTKSPEDWLNPLFILGRCPFGTNGQILQEHFKSIGHFNNTFCNYLTTNIKVKGGKTVKKKKYIGIKKENLPRLKALLEDKYLRREAKDVLGLPPIRYKDVILSTSVNEQLLEAFTSYSDNPAESRMTISEIKSKASYLKTLSTLPYMIEVKNDSEGPVLVYSDHVRTAKYLGNELKKRKFTVNVITGETKSESRQKSVDRFHGGELDFLVLTIGSSNTGYNFTNCQNLIFNDLSWRAEQNKQVEKRIHRKGQTGVCVIHRMMGDAADEHIVRVLDKKNSDIRRLV